MTKKTNFGLLVVSPEGRNKNIGDYIQSIAQRQFLPCVDECVQRENISSYDNDSKKPIALIMNAWYMWHPENWPPSKLIIPLPISIHLSPVASREMLRSDGIKWFKEHEPIGCRDMETKALLEANGVKSYFSACLTLTLYKSFDIISDDKRKGVCFINPYIPKFGGFKQCLSLLIYALKTPRLVLSLWSKHRAFFECGWNYSQPDRKHSGLKSFIRSVFFVKIYSQKFRDEVLLGAEYINHTVDANKYSDDSVLLDYAECLLKKYATQKYVVTSRIHAGLPCLSLGTPVIFVLHPDIVGETSNGNRLGGLIDFFHCVFLDKHNRIKCDDIFSQQKRIDESFSFKNKETWKKYAEQLIEKCEKFVEQFL